MLNKIISGGQTGADRAGLEAAEKLNIITGGYAPKDFLTENGNDLSLQEKFRLEELYTKDYRARTIKNIKVSDGTVIFCKTDSNNIIRGTGTKMTRDYSIIIKKPVIINPTNIEFIKWLFKYNIKILNVAGNRESQYPGLNEKVKSFLVESLTSYYESYEFIKAIVQLRKDNKSGSVSILNKFIKIIKKYLNTNYQNEILIYYIKYLQNRYKLFSVLNHFINGLLLNVNDNKKCLNYINDYIHKWGNIEEIIAINSFKKIKLNKKTILLHSNSNTIIEFIKYLKNNNVTVNIIQTESNPRREGIIQAKKIKDIGFKLKLIEDSSFKKFISKIDIAIFGADSITKKYFVNKKRTLLMSKFCYENKIPVYVLADSRKITKVNKSEIKNSYFEKIPNKYVKAIMTEKGVFSNDFRKNNIKKRVI